MTHEQEQIVALFEKANVSWYFRLEHERSRRAMDVQEESRRVEREYARISGARMTEPLLHQMLSRPEEMAPLVQAFAARLSVPMKTMIYCLLTGGRIERGHFEYAREREVALTIEVTLRGGQTETFTSDEVWDMEVLRHFGVAKRGGRPFIDGYYAFRKP